MQLETIIIAVLALALALLAGAVAWAFLKYWPRIEKAEIHRLVHLLHSSQHVLDFDKERGRNRLQQLATKTAFETEEHGQRGIPDPGQPAKPATEDVTDEQPADFSDAEWEQALFRARAARGLTSLDAVVEDMRIERELRKSKDGFSPIGL